MPSEGHPFPLSGSQNGEEYGRVPTSVIGVPPLAPVTVHAAGAVLIGQGMFGPPAVGGGGRGEAESGCGGGEGRGGIWARRRARRGAKKDRPWWGGKRSASREACVGA